MEIDSSDHPSPDANLIQSLLEKGVPYHYLECKQVGLVHYVKENRNMLQDVVSALFPGVEEAQASESARREFKEGCREGIRWAQWLMFDGDPEVKLKAIQQQTGHVKGVCGAVWGLNDIAYRCHTCENDPTCAICVPCFEAGNHVNHDYSMIHAGGGCCDCGDITAWKESGFCSQHRGPGQAPSLSESVKSTLEPVMEAVLLQWQRRLQDAAKVAGKKPKKWDSQTVEERVASQLSLALVEMLLNFCNWSESMLTFIGGLIASDRLGLLDVMLTSECFLPIKVVNKLHELLFKLMGDPVFKFQFARAFIARYPHLVRDAISEESELLVGSRLREHPTLSSFSVQIFTVPTLTPRLVFDLGLLDMLLETLKYFLLSCAGDDGRLSVTKGPLTTMSSNRIVEDIRFVMRHLDVAQYVARERPDLSKAWLHLLAYTQGMDSQRRQTNVHVEEDTDNWLNAYLLEVQMANVHPLFIDGAAKTDSMLWLEGEPSLWTDISCREELEDEDIKGGHAKIGRISGPLGVQPRNCKIPEVPSALLWLISECAKVLHMWLILDAYPETMKLKCPSMQKIGGLQQREMQRRGRGGRGVLRVGLAGELGDSQGSVMNASTFREWLRNSDVADHFREGGRLSPYVRSLDESPRDTHSPSAVEAQESRRNVGDSPAAWWMGSQLPEPSASLGFTWGDRDWLEIDFDVSQQEVSFHIPLHRFLSLALQKSLEIHSMNQFSDFQGDSKTSWHHYNQSINDQGFLMKLFPSGYQVPSFASFLMEHPLRLQVFCAQVRAGMWRRNGHSVQTLCDHYYSVRWCEDSSDLDLFLLQCCGVMAPPEEFVERIVSRFGLADYFSLFLLRPNEYETTLAQQMLSLLICIVVERGFCGYSAAQACRRELIRRLAISDATHSQLMKSLAPRLHDNKQWEEALDSVSTYYKPSGMQQGRYSLREECWKELDLYHPRWTARELQCAEDRYLRACKVPAVVNQLPQWQKPFAPLQSLSRIATCARVHDILRSVLFHAVFSEKISESRAPEGVLIMALHLLALGLDVCKLFSYDNDVDYRPTSLEGGSNVIYSSHSSTHHAEEAPPLLAKATERVYTGGADGTELSSRQSLLSLLVLLMKKYDTGEGFGSPAESHQGGIGILIKSLLEKFAKLHRSCMNEIESLAPDVLHRVIKVEKDTECNLKVIEQSQNLSEAEKRKLLAKERQAAIMAKMKAAQDKFAASLQHSQETDDMNKSRSQSRPLDSKKVVESRSQSEQSCQNSTSVVCALCRDSSSDSPLSFLTFVQRSRLLAIAEKGQVSWEKGGRQEDTEPLSLGETGLGPMPLDNGNQDTHIHVELLNLIHMALNGEIDREGPLQVEDLLEFLEDQDYTHISGRQTSVDTRMEESSSSETGSDDMIEEEPESSSDSANVLLSDSQNVMKDEADANDEEKNKVRENFIKIVLQEYVTILSRNHKEQELQQQQQQRLESENSVPVAGQPRHRFSRSSSANTVEGLLHDYIGSDDNVGVHMSSCGHAVHQECLDRYLSSLLQRYHSRTLFEGLQIVNPDQGEFLCPVCRRLANSVLPSFKEITLAGTQREQSTATSSRPFTARIPSRTPPLLQVVHAMYLLCNAEELIWKLGFRKAVSKPFPKALKLVFDCLFSRLCGLYFPERESNFKSTYSRVSQSLLLWDVLRYTIMSSELAARTRKTVVPSRIDNNLESLWKAADLSKGSVLPLLLRAAKAIQNQNRQSLLLRARGMQLLVGSICFGQSKDYLSEPFIPGDVSKILQQIGEDNGREGTDIQFWKRTADPVLAHDPFSSLLWLIFCLPLSFPSSSEPFISLVHLLYLVCVTQILFFLGKSVIADLQISSSAQVFLETTVTNLSGFLMYQTSDDRGSTMPSGPALFVIRRFTLTYLCRCALLERLLFNAPADEECKGEKVKTYDPVIARKAVDWINSESRQSMSDAFEDLKQLEELEQRFCIPSLQTILEDETSQECMFRWCGHLSGEASNRKIVSLPRPVMAAPFKLMELPTLYQTLLQRYLKEKCPNCSTVPDQPALCLLCGTLCCAPSRRSCGCNVNRQRECFSHAMVCGSGIGVFLMIRKTNILLQRCARQASWPSPYLDAFGEEDLDMQRGKPLYLNEERYAALTTMVVSHGLDHSSQVLSHTTWETVVWG